MGNEKRKTGLDLLREAKSALEATKLPVCRCAVCVAHRVLAAEIGAYLDVVDGKKPAHVVHTAEAGKVPA